MYIPVCCCFIYESYKIPLRDVVDQKGCRKVETGGGHHEASLFSPSTVLYTGYRSLRHVLLLYSKKKTGF